MNTNKTLLAHKSINCEQQNKIRYENKSITLYWPTNIKTREEAKKKIRTSSGTIHPHIRVK